VSIFRLLLYLVIESETYQTIVRKHLFSTCGLVRSVENNSCAALLDINTLDILHS
jgi:hypothetical protein